MPMYPLYDSGYFATNTADKLLELVKQLDSSEGDKANKSLNYYDGRQEEELVKFLNAHRKGWMQDNVIPRTRNLTKMIVEKSGQIIHNTPPIYTVFENSESDIPDELHSEHFEEIMNKSDSIETFINLDEVVRLLKTALVLVQYDQEEQCMVYDILHRGNALVKWNPVSKDIYALLHKAFSDDGYSVFRLYLKDLIIDFAHEAKTKSITIIGQEENPTGIVPATQFYDTQAPRTGFWNHVPMDLVSINEIYNVHITESEYAIGWMKKPTLFTNAQLGESHIEEQSHYDNGETSETHLSSSKFPHQHYGMGDKVKFGPSTAVQLDTTGVDGAFAEFKSPDVNIQPIDQVVEHWVQSYASDWSVSVDIGGTARASSGFQLIVEELPNLQLRKQRQKMFAIGLGRLFDIIKTVANTYSDATFPEESKLFVEFSQPNLPVDEKVQEDLWTTRINENRASLVDYFVETQGMSQEEAVDKIAEIIEFNAAVKKLGGSSTEPAPQPQQQQQNPNDPVYAEDDNVDQGGDGEELR